MTALDHLLEIMRKLRDKESGCPWDIVQTFETIAPYTIEEAYEVADAIERGNFADLKDELGDLLLLVVYHAQMAEEAGHVAFEDVAAGVAAKMIRRHPHVFGDESRDKTAEDQTRDWEAIKAAERAGSVAHGALDGVAMGLPGMTRAVKLQNRAARVGFDWSDTKDVLQKIVEEAGELAEARDTMTAQDVEEEFGDLLFVMANLARHLNVDPETAVRATNAKFMRRFQEVEARLRREGRSADIASLEEMDAHWDAIKAVLALP